MPNTQRNTPKPTAPNVPGPNERFQLLKAWMVDRKATNYMSVFAAAGEQFTDDETATIRDWFNSRARLTDEDLPTLARMERVVNFLKTAA